MAAPKGNQYAAGTEGRPPEKEYTEWAKMLDEWANRTTSLALVQFCAENDTYPRKIYELRDASEEFSQSLEKAKAKIAARLHVGVHSGDLNEALAKRYMPFNDKFIHDYEEECKDRDAKRQKTVPEHTTPEILEAHAALLRQVEALRKKD